ncbi:MAG: hypothetical protein KGY74_11230, partial [Candidatus Cloacimonetes bacterium]|nr:hypothetical protein [Candidatus Cloacimonadota bacterium]
LVFFLHPTPEQQYEEHIRIRDNINRLSKESKQEDREVKISDFKQDDLSDISEYDEFFYILGLSVYDIFSNNHEVIGNDNKIYDFGSLRGSGRFIADFFNDNFSDNSKKYNYMDFYMGTVWIKERGDLTPIYEYIFRKLKDFKCDWKYSFPRMYLVDLQKLFDSSDEDNLKHYKPETAVQKKLELTENDKQTKKFQKELDKIYKEEYENAKYKPLSPIVQAYKNIYGQLPNGHPQKEFE